MSRSSALHDWKLNTSIAKLLGNLEGASTDQLIRAVNSKLVLADFAQTNSQHYRVEAGQMLTELRRRVVADGGDWWAWHKEHFARSRKDAEKLLAIAAAENPEQAAEHERDRNREYKKSQRVRDAADVSGQSNIVGFRARQSEVDKVFRLIKALTDQQQDQLWLRCKRELSSWPL